MAREFYTVDEIPDLLRVRPGTIRNRLTQGMRDLPPSLVIGRRRLFRLKAYEDWTRRHLFERCR